jgi:hypothetical protein
VRRIFAAAVLIDAGATCFVPIDPNENLIRPQIVDIEFQGTGMAG